MISELRQDDEVKAVASSVWTKDHGGAMRMAKRFDIGYVWVNCHFPLIAKMPHGGYKHSGYGKDLPMCRLEDYSSVNTSRPLLRPGTAKRAI